MTKLRELIRTLQRSLRDSESIWRAGMFGVVFFFILTGTAIVVRLSDLGQEAKNVSSTHFSLKLMGDLLGAARDEEIGQRGFLITRDPSFLEPKEKADKDIPVLIDQLKRLAVNDPIQTEKLDHIEELVNRRVAEIDTVLRIGKEQSLNAAAIRMKESLGKNLMDNIRAELLEMEIHEAVLLRDRLDSFERTRMRGKYIAGGTIIAMLILTLITIYLDAMFRRNKASFTRESTSRKAAEEALQHSQSRLRTALIHLPLRLYSTDREGRYTWLHDPQRLFQLKDFIGKRDDELFEPTQVQELIALQKQVIASGEIARKTLRLPFSGSLLHYDVTIEPDRATTGEVLGLTVSAFDIQHQIDLQLAIEQKAHDLRAIADTMPQMVWAADEHGLTDYYNLRWHEYTGTTPDEDLAANRGRFVHPEDYPKVQELWQHSVKTGEPYETECRFRNGITGEYRWFVVRALPVRNQEGKITRWFGTCTDLHDKRLLSIEREHFLESERAARKQVEHVMASKEAYIATLTHELRGPLNSILGWTQLLRSKKDKETDLKLLTRAIDVIEENARNQSQLVSDLFELQGINAGKVVLDIERLNLSQLIDAAADSVLPACAERNITLIKKIEPNVCDIPGEGRRISQVVMNLLNNSLKFTPHGGSITIELRREAENAIIEVHDTGIGMDESSLPHIFDRYNQGSARSADKNHGLGLGLTIARSIVQLHGGKIGASSEGIGRGSIFRIHLPCDSNKAISKKKPAAPTPKENSLSGLRVLLVEDQDDAREALARILTAQGAEVDAVSSAPAALKLMDKKIPQMIISDISMPEMDGYMFMREVRRRHSGLRAIALTAFTRKEDKQRAMDAGFDKHISKPLDAALLIEAIRSLAPSSWDYSTSAAS